jgi:hypothetical protein
MDYKKVSFGLGVFSLVLGAAELIAPKKVADTLDAGGHEGVVKGFGARDIAAGVGLLVQPAVSTGVWNRVLGDVMDLASLGLAARKAPDNKAVWGSLAFVGAVTALDVAVAFGLDKQTGKIEPTRHPALAAA